jgi:CRP/FNR family transcriptional regulator
MEHVLCNDCPLSPLKGHLKLCKPLWYRRGETIFEEGSPAFGMYCVCSGAIKLFRRTLEGKRQIICILGPRRLLGIEVLAKEFRHTHCAEAMEDSRVFFIAREDLANLPEVREICTALARDVILLEGRIADLLRRSTVERVMRGIYLLQRQKVYHVANEELAALVGSCPETVCRILGELEERNLIQRTDRKIRIVDPQRFLSLLEHLEKEGVRASLQLAHTQAGGAEL